MDCKHTTFEQWGDIAQYLDGFPPPQLTFRSGRSVENTAWVFRGVTNSQFNLAPSIERIAKDGKIGWATLEVKVAEEFKSRAHMYLGPTAIPNDELTWLALMQHYGIPTRLLDFTFSPFVALFFALRNASTSVQNARIWAFDSAAINRSFMETITAAKSGVPALGATAHIPAIGSSQAEILRGAALAMNKATVEALAASGTFREELNLRGCVCMTMPPSFNPRLASQQGVFLLNCAEDLAFSQSLGKMMKPATFGWCEIIDIHPTLFSEAEDRLFQSNTHEQSLFPDIEGLAGFLKQRIRLHWK